MYNIFDIESCTMIKYYTYYSINNICTGYNLLVQHLLYYIIFVFKAIHIHIRIIRCHNYTIGIHIYNYINLTDYFILYALSDCPAKFEFNYI